MKQKLKMIWRILRDRQVVVITEDHGRMYYTPWSEAKELKEKLRIKLKRVLLNV